jgi:hypothetical protein
MPFIDSLQWENLNSLRNYPIRDDLTLIDNSGVFTIPNDFIVDIQLSISSDPSISCYISQIESTISYFEITISDSNNLIVGSFTIPVTNFSNYSDYLLQTVPGDYQSSTGRITIGSLNTIQTLTSGIFLFSINATEFLPRVINVSTTGVDQITFLDSKGNTQTLTGSVNVVARNNLRYSYDSVNNLLILDAGDGLGLNSSCTTLVPVQSINGVQPDPLTGNISFIGLGCSNINTDTQYTLQLEDSCCTPCSGCDDLSSLTQRVNQLELSCNDLKTFLNQLNTELTAFTNIANSSCACPT